MTADPPRSRFIFYCTAPVLLAFLVLMPLLVRPPEAVGWVMLVACELLALMVLLGLFDSVRFWWCWRTVGAMVFVGCLSYLVSTALAGNWFGDGRPSSATVFNAAFSLLVFGLPGLWFAIFGRLTFRPESEVSDDEDDWYTEDQEVESEPRR